MKKLLLVVIVSFNYSQASNLDCRGYCQSRWQAYNMSLEGDYFLDKNCSKLNHQKLIKYLTKKNIINYNTINSLAFLKIYCNKTEVQSQKECVKRICPGFLDSEK